MTAYEESKQLLPARRVRLTLNCKCVPAGRDVKKSELDRSSVPARVELSTLFEGPQLSNKLGQTREHAAPVGLDRATQDFRIEFPREQVLNEGTSERDKNKRMKLQG